MDETTTQYENGQEIVTHDGILLKKASATHMHELNTTGTLTLMQYVGVNNELCIEWLPAENLMISDTDTQEQDDWSFVDTIARRNRTASESLAFNAATNTITVPPAAGVNNSPPKMRLVRANLKDLKYLEVMKNGHIIKLVNRGDGKTHSEYFFQHGNADGFVKSLQTTNCLRRGRGNNRNQFEIVDPGDLDHDKLKTTFAELRIDDIKGGSGWLPNLVRDPLTQTMGFLAKMSDVYNMVPNSSGNSPTRSDIPNTMNSSTTTSTATDEYEVLDNSPKLNGVTNQRPSRLENNEVRDAESKLAPRPLVMRSSSPLNEKQWREFQTEDGRISDVERVKEIIFHGGIEDSLRQEVWKYLLNYDAWDQTYLERTEKRRKRTQEYFQMKVQWLTMSAVQENNFEGYRDRKCQIEKDVKRTDRTLEFFAGDDNKNVILLQDILMTYVMYNFDLGYVQGMSDLLATILMVMEKETDAFWCFVGFMDIVLSNFDLDQAGMKRQLHDMYRIMSFTNPRLSNYFNEHGSGNMYFCFRWLLVWFKREFSHDDIMQLWEVLWTGLPCDNFHLMVGVAILDTQMNIFIDNSYEFNEILKHVNDLSLRIDLKSNLEKAEAIYLQMKTSPHLTDEFRMIMGEEPLNRDEHKSDEEDDEESFDDFRHEKSPIEEERLQRKLDEACEYSMMHSFM